MSLDEDKCTRISSGHLFACCAYLFDKRIEFLFCHDGLAVPERIGCIGCTKTNCFQGSSELRLEENYEQDRNDVKKSVKQESDHIKSDNAAESNKQKDKNDTLDELPGSGLSDEHQERIEKESYERDIDCITDKIPDASKEERAFIEAVKKLSQEFEYLSDDRCVGHRPVLLP